MKIKVLHGVCYPWYLLMLKEVFLLLFGLFQLVPLPQLCESTIRKCLEAVPGIFVYFVIISYSRLSGHGCLLLVFGFKIFCLDRFWFVIALVVKF